MKRALAAAYLLALVAVFLWVPWTVHGIGPNPVTIKLGYGLLWIGPSGNVPQLATGGAKYFLRARPDLQMILLEIAGVTAAFAFLFVLVEPRTLARIRRLDPRRRVGVNGVADTLH